MSLSFKNHSHFEFPWYYKGPIKGNGSTKGTLGLHLVLQSFIPHKFLAVQAVRVGCLAVQALRLTSFDCDCLDRYNSYYIYSLKKGSHEKGSAAEGRATSFVLTAKGRHFCILALNKVNIVAVTSILVLHAGNGRSEHV